MRINTELVFTVGSFFLFFNVVSKLIKESKEIGLKINSEETKCMITSRQQNIVQTQNIVNENLSFENVETLKYLGITITNINNFREEIKRRINLGNACYYSIEKILSSLLLFNKLKANTYGTIILPAALYGCETWSLT